MTSGANGPSGSWEESGTSARTWGWGTIASCLAYQWHLYYWTSHRQKIAKYSEQEKILKDFSHSKNPYILVEPCKVIFIMTQITLFSPPQLSLLSLFLIAPQAVQYWILFYYIEG